MTIEKLSNSAVKITIDGKEMLKYGISFDTIDEDSIQTRYMITEILKNIKDDTGMNLMDSELFVEAFLSDSDKYCIIYISIIDDNYYDNFEPYIFYMIGFDDIKNFIIFAESIKNYADGVIESSLYEAVESFMLTLKIISDYEENILTFATELGDVSGYGEICKVYAEEHFKCLLRKNAVISVFEGRNSV